MQYRAELVKILTYEFSKTYDLSPFFVSDFSISEIEINDNSFHGSGLVERFNPAVTALETVLYPS